MIPRNETETYTTKLAGIIRTIAEKDDECRRRDIRILDLCTGTGCISLLLHSLLRPPSPSKAAPLQTELGRRIAASDVEILGVDISARALTLANENLRQNVKKGFLHPHALQEVSFVQADVLSQDERDQTSTQSHPQLRVPSPRRPSGMLEPIWEILDQMRNRQRDVVLANPPYISPSRYAPGGTMTKIVRLWEPKLALVPPAYTSREYQGAGGTSISDSESYQSIRGDEFYMPIFRVAKAVQAKVVLVEVADDSQASRVMKLAGLCFAGNPHIVREIWRDDGTVQAEAQKTSAGAPGAEARAVVVWTSAWAKWRL